MFTILTGILMLGILVFVHELGHFAVAKMAGVKVLKFSLGFGPRLFSRQWGETEYMICAIPLGGYVQMFGEQEEAEGAEANSEEDRERSFAAKPVSRRLAIVAAGPFMNLALPFLILPLAYMVGISLPTFLDQPACVGYVVEESPAAEAGLMRGDCVTAIGDKNIDSWSQADKSLLEQAGKTPMLTVRRNGRNLNIAIPAEQSGAEGLQSLGVLPEQSATVGSLAAGMPAQRAGLEAGDRIVAIDNQPVDSWYDLRRLIKQNPGPRVFQVERDGQLIEKTIEPIPSDEDEETFLIGISPQMEVTSKQFSFPEAVRLGAERSLELIELTVVFIQKLIFGHVSTKNIGGPITVVQVAGQAAQTDLASIISVLAFLSIQLGILNLFPIPILDGGHILFNLFELVFRRPLTLRVREVAQQIGLVLILLLMALAFYNDIVRLFLGGQQ